MLFELIQLFVMLLAMVGAFTLLFLLFDSLGLTDKVKIVMVCLLTFIAVCALTINCIYVLFHCGG